MNCFSAGGIFIRCQMGNYRFLNKTNVFLFVVDYSNTITFFFHMTCCRQHDDDVAFIDIKLNVCDIKYLFYGCDKPVQIVIGISTILGHLSLALKYTYLSKYIRAIVSYTLLKTINIKHNVLNSILTIV
jgi:hypothetical protein